MSQGIREKAFLVFYDGGSSWRAMKDGNLVLLIVVFLILALSQESALGAAYPGGLSGNETPMDSSSILGVEFGGPSQIISGVFNKDDDAGNATCFLASFGGGLIALRYSPTYGGGGVIDREYERGGQPVYALQVCGVNSTDTGYTDYIFEVSQDANLTNPSYGLNRLSANGTGARFVSSISISTQPAAIACKERIAPGGTQEVFLALGREVVAWDSSLSNNDTLTPGFTPTALALMGDISVTGTQKDILVVGGAEGEIALYEVNGSRLGDANGSNAFSDMGLSAQVDGQVKSIKIFVSSDVDSNDTSDEALIFVGTGDALYLFELDDNGSNPAQPVLESKGDLTGKFGVSLDVRDVYLEPQGDLSLRDGFLIMAGGSSGTHVFKTGGDSNGGTSATDTFYLTYLATFPTGSSSIKVLSTGGTIDSTSIERIYVLEGGGGLKVLRADALTGPGDAQIELDFNWSPVIEGQRARVFDIGSSDYGLLLTGGGELRLYELTSGVPSLVEETTKGATGGALLFSSFETSDRAHDLFATEDQSNSTTIHTFSAMGDTGLVYCKVSGIGTTSFRYEDLTIHETEGRAIAVHGFYNAVSSTFTLGVAMGEMGASFITFDSSSNDFSKVSTVTSGASISSLFLVHSQAGEDYAYLGAGGGMFYIFKITKSSSSIDYLSNPSLVGTLHVNEAGGTTFIRTVVVRQGERYYAYLLGNDGRLYVVDCTNPVSPTLTGTYPQEEVDDPGGVVDFSIFEDQTNQRWYALCASRNRVSESDPRRLLFTINVTDPAHIRYGHGIPLDPLGFHFVPQAISTIQETASGRLRAMVAATLGTDGGPGMVGAFHVTLTGPQNLVVSFSLNSCPTAPGNSVIITPAVSGGDPPYSYSWNEPSIEEMGGGEWQWHAPEATGTYYLRLNVTDSDGNTGSASRRCRVEYGGVTVEERIAISNSRVKVPVVVSGVDHSLDAWGLSIQYDAELLEFLSAEASDDTLGWTISVEEEGDSGTLRVGGVSNGFPPIPSGASATLFDLTFSVKSVEAPGSPSCLDEEVVASITPTMLQPTQLMGDLAGVELHGGQVMIVLPGDVDADLCVTPQDALDVFLSFLGVSQLREDQVLVGDMDRDGSLSPNDAVMILDRYLRR